MGYSQHRAAWSIGVDMVTVSRYERGVITPSLARATTIEIITDGKVMAKDWTSKKH
jgi:predicted transcriptional regulator